MAGILTTGTSQVQADATVAVGHTVTVTNLTYVPQPGASRIINVFLTVDAITVTLSITVRDDAFEDTNIYGGTKREAQTESVSL